jgi:FkbM family methyltransferase
MTAHHADVDSVADPLAPAGHWSGTAYRTLIRLAPIARTRMGAAVWERAWNATVADGRGVTTIDLHGSPTTINVGHPYPAFMRRWPTYNAPLVEVVRLAAAAADRAVRVVDVGASVGDTALLLHDRCRDQVADIWCVEGDDVFAAILAANFADADDVHLVHALASDGAASIPALVRVHAGTASPQGAARVSSAPLDDLLRGVGPVDVVMIDTDGYDGRVLAGARRICREDRPVVQFEWHPRLAAAAGVPLQLAFDELEAAGYEHFVWFDKFGHYSHVDEDAASRAARAEWCRHGTTPAPDWHYDVVAVPGGSGVDLAALCAEPVR